MSPVMGTFKLMVPSLSRNKLRAVSMGMGCSMPSFCSVSLSNGFALSFVGTNKLNLPFGGGCTLLANAVVITVLKTDAKGDALESWKVPLTEVVQSYHQVLPVGIKGKDLVIKASNGVVVECKRP